MMNSVVHTCALCEPTSIIQTSRPSSTRRDELNITRQQQPAYMPPSSFGDVRDDDGNLQDDAKGG